MPVGAITSLIGGKIQSDAAGEAGRMQYDGAMKSLALQNQMYNQQRSDNAPIRQAGLNALYGSGGLFKRRDGGTGMAMADQTAKKAQFIQSKRAEFDRDLESQLSKINGPVADERRESMRKLANDQFQSSVEKQWAMSNESQGEVDGSQYDIDPELTRKFTNEDFTKDPGYDFRMAEGQKALERSAAAKGGLMGGAQMKALSQYGQNYASNEYQNAYNRFNNDQSNRFNRLSSIAGFGQTANAQLGQAGMNYANQGGEAQVGAGNALGAARLSQGQAWGNAMAGVNKAYQDNQQTAMKGASMFMGGM